MVLVFFGFSIKKIAFVMPAQYVDNGGCCQAKLPGQHFNNGIGAPLGVFVLYFGKALFYSFVAIYYSLAPGFIVLGHGVGCVGSLTY